MRYMFRMTPLLGLSKASQHGCCAWQHQACAVQALCGVEGGCSTLRAPITKRALSGYNDVCIYG
jgi:hypothetical protein